MSTELRKYNVAEGIWYNDFNAYSIDGKTLADFLLKTTLQAISTGSSGASLIGSSSITGLTGNDVQTLLEALKSYTDTYKDLLATTQGAALVGVSPISGVAGSNVQAILEAIKTYVDSVKQGLDVKDSVKCATTENILLTATSNISCDGISVAIGDRLLVRAQTDPKQNGIYIRIASGAFTRSTDADTNTKVSSGMYVFVEQGVLFGDSGWVLSSDTIGLGVYDLNFVQFSGAGQITATGGIEKSGNQLSLAISGVNEGTYTKVVVDTKGRVTAGSNPTTVAGYGITDVTQLAIKNIAVSGQPTVVANAKDDTFNLAAGTGITITTNATTKTITITGLAAYVHPAAHPMSFITGLDDALAARVETSKLGVLNGVAQLDADVKVVASQASAAIVTLTTTGDLLLTHAGRFILTNSSSAILLHLKSTTGFPLGTEIEIYRYGSGSVTVDVTGVTLRTAVGTPATAVIFERYTSIVLKHIVNNVWSVLGNLA